VRVLVVDDEPDLQLILRINLTRWGHEVLTAGSTAEAEAVLARQAATGAPVEGMLLDVSMPGESGLGLLDRLRDGDRLPPQVALLSAVVTGGGSVPGAEDVRFLAKPFGVEELEALVTAMAAALPG
jgi:DNA-binding response OmpR family regulator